MAKILLDYFMPISTVESTPDASTGFLKQVCLVCKPKSGQEGNVGQVFSCTSTTQVAARTDNENATQLFAAGMAKVFILLSDDLDIETALEENTGEFWTVLISDDFDDSDLAGDTTVPAVAASYKIGDILYTAKTAGVGGNAISIEYEDTNTGGAASASESGGAILVSIEAGVTTAAAIAAAVAADTASNALVSTAVDVGDETDPQVVIGPLGLENGADAYTIGSDAEVGAFDGVVGFSSTDATVCQAFAAQENRCAFFTSLTNGADNMCYAFGKLLSNQNNWTNQQYISMPLNDGVEALGDAESLFDDKVSFVINDDEFGNRLALFCVTGKAVVGPYIKKNLRIDLQSRALSWIAANQPQFTLTNAALLEQRLREDVVNQQYVQTGWIESGTVDVSLVESNFVANAAINITDPTALWRIFGEMRSTL